MGERDLCADVMDYEIVSKISDRVRESGDQIAHSLCVFYALWSAYNIRARFGAYDYEARTPEKDHDCQWREELLPFDIVKRATQSFLVAATSENRVGMSSALEQMGVTALCPIPDEQLTRMERFTATVNQRVRVIPLAELSLFSAQLGEFVSASRFVEEASAHNPGAWELFNLCIVKGLIALNIERKDEALKCLDSAISACQKDEFASLTCGIRSPNFLLAKKLLERGERAAVVRFLLECKNVWQLPGIEFDVWVDLIEDGQMPDLDGSELVRGMNGLPSRLRMQLLRARYLQESIGPSTDDSSNPSPKTPAEVMAAKKSLLEKYQNYASKLIQQKIEYLDE